MTQVLSRSESTALHVDFWDALDAAGVAFEHPGAPEGRACEGPEATRPECASKDSFEEPTGYRPPVPIGGRVFPTSTPEVEAVVKAANLAGVALHAFSRGKNWGYGSAAPPAPGQVLVDLSRMNRIVEVNDELGYCVLEAGVSQGQLAAYLEKHHPGLWMDATGAGPDASVVGNTVDRGFGHTRYGDHFATCCGMEVVLGDGRRIRTGYGHLEGARGERVYRYGIGPMLDGVFAQSNLGIVTRIGLWLQPKPVCMVPFAFRVTNEADLEHVVDALSSLRRDGVVTSAVHVANDLRLLSARMRFPWDRTGGATPLDDPTRAALRKEAGAGAWNGLGALQGTPAMVRAAGRELKRRLRPVSVVLLPSWKRRLAGRVAGVASAVGHRKLQEQLALLEPAVELLQGKPNREHLKGVLWRVRDSNYAAGAPLPDVHDPIAENAGLRWVSPLLPMTGRDARACLDILEPIYQKHGFDPLITLTALTERAMIAVTNLAFDRRLPEEVEAAQRCYEELNAALKNEGFYPYRVAQGDVRAWADATDPFWEAVADIRRGWDPGGVLSPGRYAPECGPNG